MKPLTKLQEIELIRELTDKIWEMVEKYETKNKVDVRVNFTVDRIKRVEKKK